MKAMLSQPMAGKSEQEIVETRIDFLKRQGEIQDLKKHYKEITFPAI